MVEREFRGRSSQPRGPDSPPIVGEAVSFPWDASSVPYRRRFAGNGRTVICERVANQSAKPPIYNVEPGGFDFTGTVLAVKPSRSTGLARPKYFRGSGGVPPHF